jgi:CxxC-x17-CxxC domain-containing protein
MIADLTLSCTSCGNDFVHSMEEQSFFQGQGFKNAPRRCRGCRKQRKGSARGQVSPEGQAQRSYATSCSSCSAPTQVPFRPDPARPAFCRTCYSLRR